MEVQTTAELLATEYPPIRWAVDGIIPEGVTVFAAPWKAGKSRVILDCLIGIATGTECLGGQTCQPGPVLYCALEDGPRRAQTRVRLTLSGRPEPLELDWVYDMSPVDQGGLEPVEDWLDAHPDARMVVIDVLGKVRGRGKGYDADYALVGKFAALSARHGNVAIVLVTHTNKKINYDDPTASIDGSKGLVGAAGTVMVMLRDRGEQVATLAVTGKDVEEVRWPLSLVDGRWVITAETAAHRGIKGNRGKIIDALTRDGYHGSKRLALAVGLSEDNVRQLLSRMAKAGQVVKTESGYEAA